MLQKVLIFFTKCTIRAFICRVALASLKVFRFSFLLLTGTQLIHSLFVQCKLSEVANTSLYGIWYVYGAIPRSSEQKISFSVPVSQTVFSPVLPPSLSKYRPCSVLYLQVKKLRLWQAKRQNTLSSKDPRQEARCLQPALIQGSVFARTKRKQTLIPVLQWQAELSKS